METAREALKRELQALRPDIKLHQRRHTASKAKRRTFGLKDYAQQVVLAVWVLSEYDLELAVVKTLSYDSAKQAKASHQQAKRLVEDLILNMAPSFAASVCHPEDSRTRGIAEAAQRFLAEAATRDWVRAQNLQHGVAPGYMAARIQYEQRLVSKGMSPVVADKRTANKWAQRWRKRWGIKRGMVSRQQLLTETMIQCKEPQAQAWHYFTRPTHSFQ